MRSTQNVFVSGMQLIRDKTPTMLCQAANKSFILNKVDKGSRYQWQSRWTTGYEATPKYSRGPFEGMCPHLTLSICICYSAGNSSFGHSVRQIHGCFASPHCPAKFICWAKQKLCLGSQFTLIPKQPPVASCTLKIAPKKWVTMGWSS